MKNFSCIKKNLSKLVIGLLLLVFLSLGLLGLLHNNSQPVIKVGVLHALSGTMATSEKPLVQMISLAVDQINQQGGLLGRQLELVIVDTQSNDEKAADLAERLITDEEVAAVFGCWTSACRKAVKPVFEKHRHLLFYSVQYEGFEVSNHIYYLGALPNQQIVPGARWAMQELGSRVLLLGSDYIFPRTANMILGDLIDANQGEVVAEIYQPLGEQNFENLIEQVLSLKPDVVLSTLNGDSNQGFFNALVEAGLEDLPLMSFSVAEPELEAWGGERLSQHYGVWSFFQSLTDSQTLDLVQAYQARFGTQARVSDPMVASYLAVQLWAKAVTYEQTTDPRKVNNTYLQGLSMPAPGSMVAVERNNQHLWRPLRIGHVQPDGQYQQIEDTSRLIQPTPWPSYRTRYDWDLKRKRLGL